MKWVKELEAFPAGKKRRRLQGGRSEGRDIKTGEKLPGKRDEGKPKKQEKPKQAGRKAVGFKREFNQNKPQIMMRFLSPHLAGLPPNLTAPLCGDPFKDFKNAKKEKEKK